MVVAVLVIHSVIDKSFKRGSQGYDLIVGAKGGEIPLVLNSVFYLGSPIENIPYEVYEEFTIGRYRRAVETAIPICMGHAYQGVPVIATVPEMFEDLTYLDDRKYEWAEGRNFKFENSFEAVAGYSAAREAGLRLGDEFRPVGSGPSTGEPDHEDLPFKIVGILAPTGTPNDRALFINMEGFFKCPAHAGGPTSEKQFLQKKEERERDQQDDAASGSQADDDHPEDEHEHPADDHEHADGEAGEHGDEHSDEHGHHHVHHKEVTALLVVTDMEGAPMLATSLREVINEGNAAQAVRPAEVITGLFEGIIGNIQRVLLILAVLVVVVAGIGILVSIYNSMSDRRHEIAVMRALGARRQTVMSIILFESILLALGGGLFGVLLGHGLIGALSPIIADKTMVLVRPWEFQVIELILIPGLVTLATIVGYLPAVAAYKTDVARSLTATG